MEQTEALINNIRVSYLTRHYRDCPYNSIGQILSLIYVFAGFNVMEYCTVGENAVVLHGKKIADITWDEVKQIPVFQFTSEYSFAQEKQTVFIDN